MSDGWLDRLLAVLPQPRPARPDWLTARLVTVRDPDTEEVLGAVLIDGPTGQIRTGGTRTPIHDALTRDRL